MVKPGGQNHLHGRSVCPQFARCLALNEIPDLRKMFLVLGHDIAQFLYHNCVLVLAKRA